MQMDLQFWSLCNFVLFLATMVIALNSQHTSAVGHFQNETDHFALLHFKDQISEDPNGVLNSWNDSLHHCKWPGITCNARHQRVTALNLTGQSLLGSLSPHIGNLSFLMSIELQNNRFYGEIPQEISRLFRLRNLNLTSNTFSGNIPANISQCLELRNFSLYGNHLIGEIPIELSFLSKLEYLLLGANNFTGEIPRSLGNLSSLNILALQYNNLEGILPNELGSLASVKILAFQVNKLTGEFPSSLYNVSTLEIISIAQNFIHGNLPTDIDPKMQNLKVLAVGGNQFHGHIPTSITNSTELVVLDLAGNKFEKKVPMNLGNLENLQWLGLAGNLLGHNSVDDLDFITSLTNCSNLQKLNFDQNNFGGQLHKSISNLSSQLQRLGMGGNKISGAIPAGLGRHAHLYLLELGGNLFSGAIPGDFGEFLNLQVLDLGGNLLSGQIPSTLCNITSLYGLRLASNRFEGILPLCLGKCRNLQLLDVSQNRLTGIISPNLFTMSFSPIYMDISYNSFNGSLPLEVGKLAKINVLNISYNNLSGPIPETLGDFPNLEYLSMQGNFFKGTIPSKLLSLKGIQYLDLSQNNLTGEIPNRLGRLAFLKYLNLSFNDLEGKVPTDGVFGNASLVSLIGNGKLCGGIPELQLPPCIIHQKKKREQFVIIIVVPTICMVILIFVALFSNCQRSERRKLFSAGPSGADKILRISYHELHRATAGFSPENLIGSGSFGLVYRGRLDQYGDKLVAVKVMNLQKIGASKSFKAECEVLRNIRHRNLVAILTYCSSIDFKGHEFKALVYEFMENGSLDMWLHPSSAKTSRSLNILHRLSIVSDVASALHYLHNHYDCEAMILHCDLKPSNILLDKDLTSHIGDFGLARLLSKTTKSSIYQATSSSVIAKGSIGYTAPEYGMGNEASTQGDVYSFGILMLEIFTGKKPTDDIFMDELDLHSYVKTNLSKNVMGIVDPLLLSRGREENKEFKANDDGIELEGTYESLGILLDSDQNFIKCLVLIFEIGLKCSEISPSDRMNMDEVLRQMHFIRTEFLLAKGNRGDHDV